MSPPALQQGLAWTEAGGDVLYIEAVLLRDGKGLSLTGQLGSVMQESAKAGQSYVWSHSEDLGIDQALFRRYGVHVHVPCWRHSERRPLRRRHHGYRDDFALYRPARSLRYGHDGGSHALRAGACLLAALKRKCWPPGAWELSASSSRKQTRKDLRDLPEPVREEMEFIFAEKVSEVLQAAIPGIGKRLTNRGLTVQPLLASSLLGLNPTALRAAISIGSPVLGLRPVRAFLGL